MNVAREELDPDVVPKHMKGVTKWVLWKFATRGGKPTKVPVQIGGANARSNDPATWNTFDAVYAELTAKPDNYAGLGFVLGGGYVGIDLDNCRDPETGVIDPWAAKVISDTGSYAEVSPSQTGVKIFALGPNVPGRRGEVNEETGARIEVYSAGRYFTFTGQRLPDSPNEILNCNAALEQIFSEFFETTFDTGGADATNTTTKPISGDETRQKAALSFVEYDEAGATRVGHCLDGLRELPESIEGQNGSKVMFAAACLVRRHRLSEHESWSCLRWFNENKCVPEWSDAELSHKWTDAKRRERSAEEEFDAWIEPDDVLSKVADGFDKALALAGAAEGRSVLSQRLGPKPTVVQVHGDGVYVSQQAPTLNSKAVELGKSLRHEAPARLRSVPFEQFLEKGDPPVQLVRGFLVEGQSMVIGGPPKSFKTLVTYDLCISLAGGGSFLDQFVVPKAKCVLFASGESGEQALRDDGRNIAEARNVDVTGNLHILTTVPTLTDEAELGWFCEEINRVKAEVVVIDPLYFAMRGVADQASNVYAMGGALSHAQETIKERTGAQIVLVHHIRKPPRNTRNWQPELTDLSQAGIAEFCRQYALLWPLTNHDHGRITVGFKFGGSIGHGDCKEIGIDRGEPLDELVGGRWETDVRAYSGTISRQGPHAIGMRVINAMEEGRLYTKRALVELVTGLTTSNARPVTDQLVSDGLVEQVPAPGGGHPKFRLVSIGPPLDAAESSNPEVCEDPEN